ncbi:hypothetical protein J0H58_13750 [bacterium]|nr:hypothetical protein [bacterium]
MPHPPVDLLDQTEPLSPGARLGWWGGYVFLVLVAFCFGVWTGTQKQKPVESVVVPAPTPGEKPPEQPPEPKTELTPEPKASPEVKSPESKKTPEVVTPEPKKTPELSEPKKTLEVKKTPEPKAPMVKDVLFVKEVLPIFKAKCMICHGDTKNPKGDLDLRTVASITKGGDNGPGVKASDLKTGTVWQSIDDGSMPPAGKEQLTDAEKMIVRNWILSGAK